MTKSPNSGSLAIEEAEKTVGLTELGGAMPAYIVFPPFLNQGSEGGAVYVLSDILDSLGIEVEGFVSDGIYGPKMAERVWILQAERLSLSEEKLDGNFGPDTRAVLKARYGIDVNQIKWRKKHGATRWIGPDGQGGVWPVLKTEVKAGEVERLPLIQERGAQQAGNPPRTGDCCHEDGHCHDQPPGGPQGPPYPSTPDEL